MTTIDHEGSGSAPDTTHAFIGPREDADPSLVSVAIKDLIDVEGRVTTRGSRLVARAAAVAESDADCVAALRRAGVQLIGKTNLHELAFGTTGINEAFGTPINPLDPRRVPGGSSSGSAVAVANDVCTFALGTDTGGSVRIPSACCGTAALKTTYGRISTRGVWPLAPSLDTVGPMGRTMAAVSLGMHLLDPTFSPATDWPSTVGRPAVAAMDPQLDEAVDEALRAAGFVIRPVDVTNEAWEEAVSAVDVLIAGEAAQSNATLRDDWDQLQIGPSLHKGEALLSEPGRMDEAYAVQSQWRTHLTEAVASIGLIALPTIEAPPPLIEDHATVRLARLTSPVSLAGLPAAVVPVPRPGRLPGSIQLIGPPHAEGVVVAAAAAVEDAVAGRSGAAG